MYRWISTPFSKVTAGAYLSLIDKEVSLARRHEKTMAGRIFENILFLEEVFGDMADADIPDVPVLELAKCFELSHPRTLRATKTRRKSWPLWNSASELPNHRSE